jgi:hypothetical protein
MAWVAFKRGQMSSTTVTSAAAPDDWDKNDYEALKAAVDELEVVGFLVRIMNWLGKPIEIGMRNLPAGADEQIKKAVGKALNGCLDVALKTMDVTMRSASSNIWHKTLVGTSGAVGGAFGLVSLPFELPISTSIMLRSIADVARAEGEDLAQIEPRLACIAVFGMGGRSPDDDASETGYYAARIAMGRAAAEAAAHFAKAGAGTAAKSAPVITRLLSKIAQRLTPEVAQKVAAAGIPIIGAAGGAAINLLFIDHFQAVAHGHFTVRRLERSYGEASVKKAYEQLAKELSAKRG